MKSYFINRTKRSVILKLSLVFSIFISSTTPCIAQKSFWSNVKTKNVFQKFIGLFGILGKSKKSPSIIEKGLGKASVASLAGIKAIGSGAKIVGSFSVKCLGKGLKGFGIGAKFVGSSCIKGVGAGVKGVGSGIKFTTGNFSKGVLRSMGSSITLVTVLAVFTAAVAGGVVAGLCFFNNFIKKFKEECDKKRGKKGSDGKKEDKKADVEKAQKPEKQRKIKKGFIGKIQKKIYSAVDYVLDDFINPGIAQVKDLGNLPKNIVEVSSGIYGVVKDDISKPINEMNKKFEKFNKEFKKKVEDSNKLDKNKIDEKEEAEEVNKEVIVIEEKEEEIEKSPVVELFGNMLNTVETSLDAKNLAQQEVKKGLGKFKSKVRKDLKKENEKCNKEIDSLLVTDKEIHEDLMKEDVYYKEKYSKIKESFNKKTDYKGSEKSEKKHEPLKEYVQGEVADCVKLGKEYVVGGFKNKIAKKLILNPGLKTINFAGAVGEKILRPMFEVTLKACEKMEGIEKKINKVIKPLVPVKEKVVNGVSSFVNEVKGYSVKDNAIKVGKFAKDEAVNVLSFYGNLINMGTTGAVKLGGNLLGGIWNLGKNLNEKIEYIAKMKDDQEDPLAELELREKRLEKELENSFNAEEYLDNEHLGRRVNISN